MYAPYVSLTNLNHTWIHIYDSGVNFIALSLNSLLLLIFSRKPQESIYDTSMPSFECLSIQINMKLLTILISFKSGC